MLSEDQARQQRIDGFARAAIVGVLANPNSGGTSEQDFAWYAYNVAEYMEAERAKRIEKRLNELKDNNGSQKN